MATIWLSTCEEFDLEDLARDIARGEDPEDMMTFILALDLAVADVDFTTELIRRLQESLNDESTFELQVYDTTVRPVGGPGE